MVTVTNCTAALFLFIYLFIIISFAATVQITPQTTVQLSKFPATWEMTPRIIQFQSILQPQTASLYNP